MSVTTENYGGGSVAAPRHEQGVRTPGLRRQAGFR